MDPTLETLGTSAFDNVYHVGHLVPDLLRAMETLGSAMQITWAPPFEMRSGFTRPDGSADDQAVRIAFSTSGPPYLELIEVVAAVDSIFAEPKAGGMHHVGYYAQRWRDDVTRLQDDGWEVERTGAGVAFLRDPSSGLRVEVVSFRGRDFLRRILDGSMAAAYPPDRAPVRALARTSQGTLRGDPCGEIVVFRGVPYAAAPTGERRWRPAEAAPGWKGVSEAIAFGPIPPQHISPERLAKRGLSMSEDCLTLNIWTPAVDDSRRPVLVFLHGGGQTQGHGSAPLLDGSRLARRGDIVVVTINFRLGVLGSLYAPDWHGADSTNLTLRDQIQALRWVREEIGAFGGDPGAVTVAGQSSGAIAISALLAGGCDLFDRAILQSGGLERVRSTAAASAVASELRALRCAEKPGVADILAAQRRIDTGFVPPQGPFHPCVDGDIIEEHPLVVARTRPMRAIPVLAGTTRDEWRIFDAALDEDVFTERYVQQRAQTLAGDAADADAVVATYRADHGSHRDVASAMVTDYHFTAPTEQFVRAHARYGNTVFRYELQWPSPRAGLGACHDSCLPLLFGNLDAAPALAGTGDAARRMSDVVQTLWLEFIRAGEPWDRYDRAGGPTMVLGSECEIARGHRAEQLGLWEKRYPAHG